MINFILLTTLVVIKGFDGSNLLNIDPLSIFVDQDFYRLCWKYTGRNIDRKIKGYHEGKSFYFDVFQDSQKSRDIYCIENKKNNYKYNIELPITTTPNDNKLDLTIKFSSPMGPPINVIRFKVVPKGIYFQLSSEFIGLENGNIILCNVTIAYVSKSGKGVIQFLISNIFKKDTVKKEINQGLSFDLYSTCIIRDVFSTSSSFYKESGTLYSEEKPYSLQPLIPISFSRFIMVHWKLPNLMVKVYNIAIYEQIKMKKQKCLKIFRACNKIYQSKQNCKTIIKYHNKDIPIVDLGYYPQDTNGNLFVILDMEFPLNSKVNYKLSIYWQDVNEKVQKNFIYFSPSANENSGQINPSFLYFNNSDYDNRRNEISPIVLTDISNNQNNPVIDNKIKLDEYEEMIILPTVFTKPNLKFSNLSSSFDFPKMCEKNTECGNGLFPFFYLILKNKKAFVEIIQISKNKTKQNTKMGIENLVFSPSTKSSVFEVSWDIGRYPNDIIPAYFMVEIWNSDLEIFHSKYLLECITCNFMFKEISRRMLEKDKSWNNSIKYRTFEAIEESISFQTKDMPHSQNFEARLYWITLNTKSDIIISNIHQLKASYWSRNGYIFIIVICSVIGLLIVMSNVYHFYFRKPKVVKDECVYEVSVKCSDDELYDSD